jgi:hypothetical protein
MEAPTQSVEEKSLQQAKAPGAARFLFVVCATACVCAALLLPLTYHYFETHRHAVALTSFLRVGVLEGFLTIDRRSHPYKGNISEIHRGTVPYEGGLARSRKDWGWSRGSYGVTQRTYYGVENEFVAQDVGLNLPGLYFRHFAWEQEPLLWTLQVSLWYFILFSAMPPALLAFRRWVSSRAVAHK